jgi:hypothetical protein
MNFSLLPMLDFSDDRYMWMSESGRYSILSPPFPSAKGRAAFTRLVIEYHRSIFSSKQVEPTHAARRSVGTAAEIPLHI